MVKLPILVVIAESVGMIVKIYEEFAVRDVSVAPTLSIVKILTLLSLKI